MNIITHKVKGVIQNKVSSCPSWFRFQGITGRRKEVLYWMARGKTNGEIGALIGCSPLTVKNHIRDILRIYGCPNRVSAALISIARGDISFEEIKKEFGVEEAVA